MIAAKAEQKCLFCNSALISKWPGGAVCGKANVRISWITKSTKCPIKPMCEYSLTQQEIQTSRLRLVFHSYRCCRIVKIHVVVKLTRVFPVGENVSDADMTTCVEPPRSVGVCTLIHSPWVQADQALIQVWIFVGFINCGLEKISVSCTNTCVTSVGTRQSRQYVGVMTTTCRQNNDFSYLQLKKQTMYWYWLQTIGLCLHDKLTKNIVQQLITLQQSQR